MSRYRLLRPDAEARLYNPFAFHGPWRHWSTEDRFWASGATKTQGVIAYGHRRKGTLPPVWTYVSRMERVLGQDLARSRRQHG